MRTSKIPEILSLRANRNRNRCPTPSKLESKRTRTLAERSEAALLCVTGKNSSLKQMIAALEDLGKVCFTSHCIVHTCKKYIVFGSFKESFLNRFFQILLLDTVERFAIV